MKLWHPEVISALPDSLLAALHRDVCALRGKKWGCPSPRVKHLWNYPISMLANYHKRVLKEMVGRGWSPDTHWLIPGYRGKKLKMLPPEECCWDGDARQFPEHTPRFLAKCKRDLYKRVIESTGNWKPSDLERVERIRT